MPERKKSTPYRTILKRSFWLVLIGAMTVLVYLALLSRDLPSIEQLENYDPDLVTRIYSRDGKVLHELYFQKRVFTELDQIPESIRNATIASEDRRFYEHWGISLRSFLRAVAVNLVTMSYSQGFSTLTQQLARNLYKTIGFEETITRKLKEIITAIQIERTYTKDEILEMYLNTVHFGHGTYGVQSAAKRFFGKDASDLNVDESALLVGLLPSPASYSPVNYPERALRRRNTVLRLMRDQNFISQEQYNESRAITLQNIQEISAEGSAPYFTEYIRRFMEKEDEGLGINIYRDGLKIYTTLDSRLQDIAEEVVMQSVDFNQAKLNERLFADDEEFSKLAYFGIFPKDTVTMMMKGDSSLHLYPELRDKLLVQAAFVAIDPHTGAILAMVGGRPDYPDQFNRTTQARRQPGSIFKPFAYAAAIENNYPVTEQILNQPLVLKVQNAAGEWENWQPQNYDGSTGGLMTLREGLRKSVNLVAVRLVQKIVPPKVVKRMAERMGVTTQIRDVDAIALGTSEVYPIEMVASYSIFANKGVYCKPFGVTRIEDRYGNVLKEYSPERKEVFKEEVAYVMTNMLQTVLDKGTGGSARWKYNFYHPAAAKTGTTQGYTDAWFVGYSPFIAAGVWYGVDGPPMVSLGESMDGSKAALPSWARFMRRAHELLDLPRVDFDRPAGVINVSICSESKQKPNNSCPVETEIFIKGTDPTHFCTIHRAS